MCLSGEGGTVHVHVCVAPCHDRGSGAIVVSWVVLLLLVECYALYVDKWERKAGYVCALRGDACAQPSVKLELHYGMYSACHKHRKLTCPHEEVGLLPLVQLFLEKCMFTDALIKPLLGKECYWDLSLKFYLITCIQYFDGIYRPTYVHRKCQKQLPNWFMCSRSDKPQPIG